MVYIVNIRERRQITLPREVLNQLAVFEGDKLAISVVGKSLVAKPVKEQALDTLKAIQKAFKGTKISEEKLQRSGRKIREKLVKEIYG